MAHRRLYYDPREFPNDDDNDDEGGMSTATFAENTLY
jgi:hypothetical protein